MIKSMTGYGKGDCMLERGKITLEIKTLNGKNADVNIKSSIIPKDKEIYVRQKISNALKRGTIDVFLSFDQNEENTGRELNTEAGIEYFRQITEMIKMSGNELDDYGAIWSSIVRMPEVSMNKKADIIDDDNFHLFEKTLDDVLCQVNEFRRREGEILHKDIISGIAKILECSHEIEKMEPERIEAVKERLYKNLGESGIHADESRFAQELVYYIEKLDINEERVRLRQHCEYFTEIIEKEEFPGKKLGFVLQEIGREINTTGSKANHAGIQKTVVVMKDELEKIKEQTLNIL